MPEAKPANPDKSGKEIVESTDDLFIQIDDLNVTMSSVDKHLVELLNEVKCKPLTCDIEVVPKPETVPAPVPAPELSPASAPEVSRLMKELIEQQKAYMEMLKTFPLPAPSPPTEDMFDLSGQITTAVLTAPQDPTSSAYQVVEIYSILERNATKLHVANDGPGILYVVTTYDGKNWSDEIVIFEGEHRIFLNVWELGLRSPVAGLSFRISEREILSLSGEIFSGERFGDRRDRRGVIVYKDDMESPTLKFLTTGTIGAGTITRSNDTAYSGDFSIKSVVGGNVNDINIIKYFHPDFHSGRMGVQIHFAIPTTSPAAGIGLAIELDDSTLNTLVKGNVFYRNATGEMGVFTDSTTFSIVQTGVQGSNVINSWNVMKLVVDFSTGKYLYCIINGVQIDLSTFRLFSLPPPPLFGQKYIQGFITLTCGTPGVGCQPTVYFDDYIFTEDEP